MGKVVLWMRCGLLLASFLGAQCYNTHVQDTPGLKRQMYTRLQGTNGCYKLLNTTGFIGCEDPTGNGDTAPLVGLHDPQAKIKGKCVVLIPVQHLDAFLLRVNSDKVVKSQVVGVLVDSSGAPAHSSQALTFPLEQFAPYPTNGYKWNPGGSGINRQYFDFPIFALSPDIQEAAWRRARFNADVGFKGTLHMASLLLTMNAGGNSIECMKQRTCLPIGGHSVWAAYPPFPADPATGKALDTAKPIVLVTAQVDGTALFHDLIQGAEAPMSGLLALLVAVQCLQKAEPRAADWPRRLVVMTLAGESWDLMGSRYLLYALNQSTPHVQGLVPELIQQVVEIGQVGRAAKQPNGSSTFYVHTQRTSGFADSSPLVASFQQASLATPEFPTSVRPASPSNPGVPPSSLMGFLRVNRSLPGVVLTDFDTEFSNPYYESHLDTNATITAEAMAAAAVLVARTLFAMVTGMAGSELKVDSTTVLTLVKDLTSCWLSPSPGLLCQPVTQLMAPDYFMTNNRPDFAPRHYIGVMQWKDPDHADVDPDHPQDPRGKRNIARFIWNYLANATMAGGSLQACDFGKKPCGAGEVCVGWKSRSVLGVCMKATASYVPAHSTRVTMCPTCLEWDVTDVADEWSAAFGWPADPMWAESNWPDGQLLVEMYHPERRQVEVAVLVSGVLLTAASIAIALYTRNAFNHRLKSH